MTRGSLLIIVILTAAVAAMFFWVLSLQGRQAELLSSRSSSGVPRPEGDLSGRLSDLELAQRELSELVRSQGADLGRLETRVEGVEAAGAARDERIDALGSGQPLASPSYGDAPVPGDPGLRSAIEAVLTQKEAEERRQRMERMAEGWSRFLLSDVQLTDSQRQQFVKIVAGFMEERERLRERYEGEDTDRQAMEAEMSDLERARNEELQMLLGAEFPKVQERLDRIRRGGEGRRGDGGPRGGGNRGNRPGR